MATLFPLARPAKRPVRAFDLGVAGFAAAAVGFVCFAMPADLLGALVGGTPLPSLVPAAAPPLGGTARLLLMLAAGGLTFVLLFAALGALSGPRKPRPAVSDAPRLRRADAHPDAPARRPIRAGLDLGDPLELGVAAEPEAAPELPPLGDSVPVFLERAAAEDGSSSHQVDTVEGEPAVPLPPLGGESIAELMRRLEQGLARQAPAVPPPAPVLRDYPPQPLPAEPGPASDPLADALAELERLAARR